MDTSALVMDEIVAGTDFLKRLSTHRPVVAACWLLRDVSEERYLYAALDGLTLDNTDIAYREVLRITQEMKDHYMDPFRVKLISPDHPVAKAILEVYRRYPGPTPPRGDGRGIPGVAVEDLYIYPPLSRKP